LGQEAQATIFREFETWKGVSVLVSSPLLEEGIHVPSIDLVVIVDPEHYSAIQLNQMCGRLRKKEGKVILLVTEALRHLIFYKIILNEEGTQIIEFNLNHVFGELPYFDLHRLILELLFWHPQGERALLHQLRMNINGSKSRQGLVPHYPQFALALTHLLNLKRVLHQLINKKLVRKVGGKYALTFMGDAVVETGITVKEATVCLKFIEK